LGSPPIHICQRFIAGSLSDVGPRFATLRRLAGACDEAGWPRVVTIHAVPSMSPRARAGRLDQILDLPPSEEAWERIRGFFTDWPSGPSLYSAVMFADRVLRAWPDELRVTGYHPVDGTPDPWWQMILQDTKLPGYAPLIRALSVGPNLDGMPDLERLRPLYRNISTVVSSRPLPARTVERLRESLPTLKQVVVKPRS
jgi:hypothetical protein